MTPLDLTFATLEGARNSFHRAAVSKVERMESKLRKLSQAELRQIREWLDDFIPVQVHYVGTGDNIMVDRVILDQD